MTEKFPLDPEGWIPQSPDAIIPANGHRKLLLFRPEDWRILSPTQDAPTTTVADVLLRAGLLTAAGVGWLGLVLAQLGRFSLRNLLAVTLLAAVGLAGGWYRRHRRFPHLPRMSWPDVAVIGLLVLAFWLYTPPADYALAVLDAGWYANTGALIARTGRLTVRPGAFAALSAEQRRLFVWSYQDARGMLPQFPDIETLGFYDVAFATNLADDGRVGPYHPPGFSIWVAILDRLGGPRFGEYAAPLFGLLFVLAVYGAARAAFNTRVGVIAASLTAITPPVVYYSRTPFAEVAAGALIWGGVYALTRYQRYGSTFDGFLAGLAFGAALHTKIESWLLLVPLTFLLAARFAQPSSHPTIQPSTRLAILLPFVPLAAHATLLGATVLRPYVVLNGYGIVGGLRNVIEHPAAGLAVVGLVIAGSILVRLTQRENRRPALAFGILAVGGGLLLLAARETAWLLPISGLMRFLTPLGAGLAILGAVRLIGDEMPFWTRGWIIVVVLLGSSPLVAPMVTQSVSPLYAVRRQVPVVIPTLWVLAAYALAGGLFTWVHHRRGCPFLGPFRGTSAGWAKALLILAEIAAALGLLLVVVIHLVQVDRRLPERELAGSSAFVADLATRFRSNDVVLFEGVERGGHVGRFAAPLWARHGVQALVLAAVPPPVDRLTAAVELWEQQGRNVFLVSLSDPPPFTLQRHRWELVDRLTWVGPMAAATERFPPESKLLRVPFYIYRVSHSLP